MRGIIPHSQKPPNMCLSPPCKNGYCFPVSKNLPVVLNQNTARKSQSRASTGKQRIILNCAQSEKMKGKMVFLICSLCILTVFLAGCAGIGPKSSDPAVGMYGDPTRSELNAVTFTLNGDGTFTWKFPLYTVNGRWERIDSTTISLEGNVESSAGSISVPKTISFDPEKKTLLVGSTTYKMGVTGKKSRVVAFTAISTGDTKEIHDVRVVLLGGQSVADTSSYVISIDGKTATEVTDITVGKETMITGLSPGSHRVVVTAKFTDDTESIMLDNRV